MGAQRGVDACVGLACVPCECHLPDIEQHQMKLTMFDILHQFAHNVPIDDLDYVGIDQTFLVAA